MIEMNLSVVVPIIKSLSRAGFGISHNGKYVLRRPDGRLGFRGAAAAPLRHMGFVLVGLSPRHIRAARYAKIAARRLHFRSRFEKSSHRRCAYELS
jgi:hypothetical protein